MSRAAEIIKSSAANKPFLQVNTAAAGKSAVAPPSQSSEEVKAAWPCKEKHVPFFFLSDGVCPSCYNSNGSTHDTPHTAFFFF